MIDPDVQRRRIGEPHQAGQGADAIIAVHKVDVDRLPSRADSGALTDAVDHAGTPWAVDARQAHDGRRKRALPEELFPFE